MSWCLQICYLLWWTRHRGLLLQPFLVLLSQVLLGLSKSFCPQENSQLGIFPMTSSTWRKCLQYVWSWETFSADVKDVKGFKLHEDSIRSHILFVVFNLQIPFSVGGMMYSNCGKWLLQMRLLWFAFHSGQLFVDLTAFSHFSSTGGFSNGNLNVGILNFVYSALRNSMYMIYLLGWGLTVWATHTTLTFQDKNKK